METLGKEANATSAPGQLACRTQMGPHQERLHPDHELPSAFRLQGLAKPFECVLNMDDSANNSSPFLWI